MGNAASSQAGQKKTAIIAIGSAVVILYVALNIGIWLYARNKSAAPQSSQPQITENQSPTASPTPTIVPLSSKGKYKFSVSAGGKPGLITSGILNPVDPPMGGTQEFEVTAVPGATALSVVLKTDTKESPQTLTPDPQNPNIWRGSWTLNDTYSYVYTLNVKGTVNGNSLEIPIMFR